MNMSKLDGNMIVYMDRGFLSYTDTYLSAKAFPVSVDELHETAAKNGGWLRLDAQPLAEGNRHLNTLSGLDTWKRGILNVDYIVALGHSHPFQNIEIEYEHWPFVVLRNLDPDFIYLQR